MSPVAPTSHTLFVRKPVSRLRSSRPPPPKLLAGVYQTLNEGVLIAAPYLERTGLRILYVNDALCRITGFSAADLVDQTHGILHSNRADLKNLRQWRRQLPATPPLSGDGYLHHADGTNIYAG
ncbi:MAG: PAS domain-containing protein [Candidatus Synoicihabitans palmerolidicus]|nr:PAS domain-containing protein [Candidatus Synoicihabitans palmerolidicus]